MNEMNWAVCLLGTMSIRRLQCVEPLIFSGVFTSAQNMYHYFIVRCVHIYDNDISYNQRCAS
jgi:hypothetical protein